MENYQHWAISAHDRYEQGTYVRRMSTSQQLLTSVQVARFVAQGFLRLDGVVPQKINERAIAALAEGLPAVSYGTPLVKAFAPDTFVHELLALPVVAGAVESLVGF